MSINNDIFKDCKTGTDFENWIVRFLKIAGFTANKTGGNDGGIDIVATINIHSNEYKYYIQCKYFNTTLSKHPIQEIYAGAHYYEETSGKGTPVVITNNAITREARLYAKRLGVEIIADAEWDEIKQTHHKKEVTNPNTHKGLLGIIISAVLQSVKSPQAEQYLNDVLAEEPDAIPEDKEELILQIQNEFDEAEEYIKESSRMYQRAAQSHQKGMNIYRDIVIKQIKYG